MHVIEQALSERREREGERGGESWPEMTYPMEDTEHPR